MLPLFAALDENGRTVTIPRICDSHVRSAATLSTVSHQAQFTVRYTGELTPFVMAGCLRFVPCKTSSKLSITGKCVVFVEGIVFFLETPRYARHTHRFPGDCVCVVSGHTFGVSCCSVMSL